MTRGIEVAVFVNAPVEEVWKDLAQVETHADWMRDAEAIEFVSDQQAGVGTRIRVPTRIGPLRTVDEIEFTAWDPPNRMSISHQGLFTGVGDISLRPEGLGATVTWRESVEFPLRFGGRLGEIIAAPILRWVWRSNLKRLAERF